MKIIKTTLLAVVLFAITSCQKTQNTTNNSNSSSNNNSNAPIDGTIFSAFNSSSPGNSSCSTGHDYSAQVTLPTPCTCGIKVGNVGTVSANGHSIAFMAQGSYTNYGSYSDALINQYVVCPNPGQISGSVNWVVSGGNGIGGFSYTTTKPIISLPLISHDTVHKQHSYTINHPTITADSIIYSIGDNGVQVSTWAIVKKTGSSSSVTFTQSQIQGMNMQYLPPYPQYGQTVLNIKAINICTSPFNGKTYQFINNSTFSDYVDIVNN